MQLTQVLDVVEGLLRASAHPEIVDIERFGSSGESWGPNSKSKGITGLKVRFTSTSTANLYGSLHPGEKAIPVPAELPLPTSRMSRLPVFVAQLLDVARPAAFQSWQLVALKDVGPTDERGTAPAGVSIVGADGVRTLLQASATGASVGREPDEEPFPDYVIPAGLSV